MSKIPESIQSIRNKMASKMCESWALWDKLSDQEKEEAHEYYCKMFDEGFAIGQKTTQTAPEALERLKKAIEAMKDLDAKHLK